MWVHSRLEELMLSVGASDMMTLPPIDCVDMEGFLYIVCLGINYITRACGRGPVL